MSLKRRGRVVLLLAGLAALVWGADFTYARVVRSHAAAWERTVVRDAAGLLPGFAPFSVGQGDTALLLVHGFGSSPAVFQRMAPALAARGYACRALRLPGFGEPAGTQAAAADPARWRQAVADELAALRATHRHVWIVGHSLGGALAVDVVSRQPGLVDGVVLLAPLFAVSRTRSLGVSPEALLRFSDRILVFTDRFETCFPVDAHDPAIRNLEGRDRFVPRAVYRTMEQIRREGCARIGQVRAPLLVMVTDNDRVTDGRAAERVCRQADAAPRREIVHVEPAGHVVPLDTGWEEVVARVDAFVRGAPAGG